MVFHPRRAARWWGVVASAGGLSAFTQFFQAMPPDSASGFVVVPHLDATHKSLMVELLSRHTSMPVVEVTDGISVDSSHVYVIPPNHLLTMEHGKLRLSDLPVPAESQTAIDIFLRSLAVEKGERAIGIVLSGTGSHGTLGVREIKRCGGMAMAQSPESAEFDQMPRSAIETGLVDFVLPPEQMPETLLKYVQQPYVKSLHDNFTPTANFVEELGTIVKLAREQTKCGFSSYRKNMLMRRVERRMGLMQLVDIDKYLQVLREQSSEVQSLCKDFLISVTQFFREPEAFAVLEKEVIPALVSKHTSETPIRVWVPSCATGEEAYSISMLLFEALIAAGKPVNFQVFASDINDDSIEFARRGVYPASISSDLSPTRLKQFFEAENDVHYRVNKKLRDSIVFSHQDITRRKLAEVKTHENAERLRTILNTASEAIITINEHGIVDSVNQATLSLFGYTNSELIGNNVSMLMPLPIRNNHDSYIHHFLATGEAPIIGIVREVICRRKDGSTFPADLAVSQVDHLGLFTGILRDISSRKEMQKHALEIAADEQRRIGFELHDGTQQELTGLTLYANALLETIESAATKQFDLQSGSVAQREFNEVDYNRLRSTASLIVKRLGEANQHVRDLAHGIMPVQIDAEGLRSALHELVKSTNSERIDCRFECSGDFRTLHNTTATHLYRIAQEAINNAIRHGVASHILISLTQEGERISLEVADNGIGFDNATIPRSGSPIVGMGLRTMQYRASLIGGAIQIENKPDGGTLVKCTIMHEVVENG